MSCSPEVARANGMKSKGRPKPQRNRLALHKVSGLLAEDQTPADIMLDNMLFWHNQVGVCLGRFEEELAKPTEETDQKVFFQLYQTVVNARERSQSCAVDLAPYVHPRLQAIAIQSASGNKVVIEGGLPQIEAPKDMQNLNEIVGSVVMENS